MNRNVVWDTYIQNAIIQIVWDKIYEFMVYFMDFDQFSSLMSLLLAIVYTLNPEFSSAA